MAWKKFFSISLFVVAIGESLFIPTTLRAASTPKLLKPDHTVLVVLENHAFSQIIGSSDAPYLNSLADHGAVFLRSFGVTHPSQPNYLALFSGSTQGVIDNSCPHTFSTPNLGHALRAAGLSFTGYSEDLPSPGSLLCSLGNYARKHNPWVNWQDSVTHGIPATDNVPLANFPTDYSALSTVSIVIPNQLHDMHHGKDPERIRTGDQWIQEHLAPYVQWAQQHNSLLIITWDEDNETEQNRVATLMIGPMVQAGQYDQRITHYTVLRTIAELYGLQNTGVSFDVPPLTHIWKTTLHP